MLVIMIVVNLLSSDIMWAYNQINNTICFCKQTHVRTQIVDNCKSIILISVTKFRQLTENSYSMK